MGEFDLIETIKRATKPTSASTTLGIGDDAAILSPTPGAKQLFCSDGMVEGIHFDLALTPPADVGYKAVASCLSDIAAMNGKPMAVVVSLALPKERANETFVASFYKGIATLQKEVNFDVVGGDLSRSPGPVFIDVAAVGEALHPITRAGAKPGDLVAVSGYPGTSAAGLFAMRNWKTLKEISGALIQAHSLPKPRFDLEIDPRTCHALIDISDGLASEAHHLANASNVSIEIDEARLPFHERALALAKKSGRDMLAWALYGGEDYELLGTFDPDAKIPIGFTAIGRVTEAMPTPDGKPAVTLVKASGEREQIAARGFDHFAEVSTSGPESARSRR